MGADGPVKDRVREDLKAMSAQLTRYESAIKAGDERLVNIEGGKAKIEIIGRLQYLKSEGHVKAYEAAADGRTVDWDQEQESVDGSSIWSFAVTSAASVTSAIKRSFANPSPEVVEGSVVVVGFLVLACLLNLEDVKILVRVGINGAIDVACSIVHAYCGR